MRRKKEDLLREGLDILAANGPDGLTVDALCKRLGCTKGSFYHHFDGRDAYVGALLEFWIAEYTQRVIAETERGKTPEERRELMLRNAVAVPKGPEASIRAWAVRNPLVAQYASRADTLRIDYLSKLFGQFTSEAKHASLLARTTYTLFLGSRVLCPPLNDSEYREIVTTLTTALGLRLPVASEGGE
jgi:AcrR family transcriptional regulator